MTATGKRSTARKPGTSLQGVLFLTAGYGKRAEPLSFARPKCLLPWKDGTVLGNLINQFSILQPEMMAFNASRCPELVLSEVYRHWNGETKLLFEERPLGASGTLAANAGMLKGTWVVCNTDFVMDLPAAELVEHHFRSRGSWTVLTCDLPPEGRYGHLCFNGVKRHYAGVSVISREVADIASSKQINGGFFTALRDACSESGVHIGEYYHPGPWLDMGETELFRQNTLREGSFVHPSASVGKGASLEGFYSVGAYCIINDGAVVRNSVLLEGVQLSAGRKAEETVLPWFSEGVPID